MREHPENQVRICGERKSGLVCDRPYLHRRYWWTDHRAGDRSWRPFGAVDVRGTFTQTITLSDLLPE